MVNSVNPDLEQFYLGLQCLLMPLSDSEKGSIMN